MTDQAAVSKAEAEKIVREGVPFIGRHGVVVDQVGPGTATLSLAYTDEMVRPGGTVAGPVLFGLADVALYVAILGEIGPVELAVTTSMNINFLRKPPQTVLVAKARLLKAGKRLIVGEVTLFADGVDDGPVAHVTGTYSVPVQKAKP